MFNSLIITKSYPSGWHRNKFGERKQRRRFEQFRNTLDNFKSEQFVWRTGFSKLYINLHARLPSSCCMASPAGQLNSAWGNPPEERATISSELAGPRKRCSFGGTTMGASCIKKGQILGSMDSSILPGYSPQDPFDLGYHLMQHQIPWTIIYQSRQTWKKHRRYQCFKGLPLSVFPILRWIPKLAWLIFKPHIGKINQIGFHLSKFQ